MQEPVEIKPVDDDGVGAVALGTAVWLIALVVLILLRGTLRHDGHLWWIACAATGFGLGLLGLGYCLRRRARLVRDVRSAGV